MLPAAKELEGKPVPKVTFKTRVNDQWKTVASDDIFKGKTVVLFALPGAFTPTCSSTHLPRYNELASTLRAKGVDDIVCVSVNDAFVMNQWKRDQHPVALKVMALDLDPKTGFRFPVMQSIQYELDDLKDAKVR